jgi:hypothetical protein
MNWLALTYSLPAGQSSSPRVTLWRRLKRLGTVAVTGMYILPAREACRAAFQWLAQEIRHAQCEAQLARLEQLAAFAEVVHEIDQRDSQSQRLEIACVDTVLGDWLLTDWAAAERERYVSARFKSLFQAFVTRADAVERAGT